MGMIDDVLAARAGDRAAFRCLVERFQAMAVGYAVGWVGDAAEDVAQEAFVEAFVHLHELRDAAAFPPWLRQIVRKHCDRRTRRRPVVREAVAHATSPDEGSLDRRWLLRAIAALPEQERVVVALHYLGDEPQAEVAEFLELPLSTVKKRLHSARARLRERTLDMRVLQPTSSFSDRIALFLSLRAGDVEGVRAVLDRAPELLEAEEQWPAAEALRGGLPIAHRVAPLVLAAGRGDRALVELLLQRGADVNHQCGCGNGETALWAASRSRRADVVALLLAAGANPGLKNAVGYTASEAAAFGSHDRLRIDGARFETGIKAIDLLAPLERGMLVRIHGQAGTGLMVLLAELTARFERAVWNVLEVHAWEHRDLQAFLADSGVQPQFGGDFAGRPLFVLLERERQAELEAQLPRLRRAQIAFVVDPWREATLERSPPPLAPPYDALIVTDPELAEAGVYPAIHPGLTRSTATLSPEHALIAEAVRRSDADAVRRFFAQWFGVYQHRSGKAGEFWSLEATLAGFRERLSLAKE
jgi:RNA polymerase sigma factor (sigma-70 family)